MEVPSHLYFSVTLSLFLLLFTADVNYECDVTRVILNFIFSVHVYNSILLFNVNNPLNILKE